MFVEHSVKVEIAFIYAAGAFEDKTIVAGSKAGNKGFECAEGAIEMANLFRRLPDAR